MKLDEAVKLLRQHADAEAHAPSPGVEVRDLHADAIACLAEEVERISKSLPGVAAGFGFDFGR